MTKAIMTRAHQIRKEAAVKWNCKVCEIVFGMCLRQAWKESKMSAKTLKVATRYTVTENIEDTNYVNVSITSDFKYTLRKIKGIAGRKWDGKNKVWMIPAANWEWELSEIAD